MLWAIVSAISEHNTFQRERERESPLPAEDFGVSAHKS